MSFNLPEGVDAHSLDDRMKQGGAITLPFTAPYFYVINGDSRLRQLGGAGFFGGWGVDKAQVDEAAEKNGEGLPPFGFEHIEASGRAGKTLDVYQARYMVIAPVAFRKSWFTDNNGSIQRAADYFPGSRQHIQALVYVATKDDKDQPLRVWGPGVLSAKGWQANFLLDAFTKWKAHIEKARAAEAAKVPAWCFWLSIGTFGPDPKSQMVGKGSQSSITPIEAYLPKVVDRPLLEKLYVGATVVQAMVDAKDQAATWLDAWNGQQQAKPGYDPTTDFLPIPPEPEMPPEDDIPF